MPEMVTVPASVSANSRNSAPVRPPCSAIGVYTAASVMVMAMIGPDQLARPEQRRFAFGPPFAQVALDVFDDDDGVVHHQTDRKHDGEQREQVERETEDLHQEDAADERNGYRDHRHQCRAHRAEEQKDHHDDDQQGVAEGLGDLADGIGDVFGRVIADGHVEARRHVALDGVELLAHAFDDIDGIGVRQRKDAHEHRGLAGITHRGVIVLRAQNDVRDILQAHDGVVALVDHQPLEILDRVQVGIGGQVDLDQRPLGVADGGEEIVVGERLAHLGGTDVQCRHLVGLEPDAHRESARTEDFRALHPGDRRQPRLHDAGEIIGDLRLREYVGGEAEIGGGEL